MLRCTSYDLSLPSYHRRTAGWNSIRESVRPPLATNSPIGSAPGVTTIEPVGFLNACTSLPMGPGCPEESVIWASAMASSLNTASLTAAPGRLCSSVDRRLGLLDFLSFVGFDTSSDQGLERARDLPPNRSSLNEESAPSPYADVEPLRQMSTATLRVDTKLGLLNSTDARPTQTVGHDYEDPFRVECAARRFRSPGRQSRRSLSLRALP